MKERPLIFSTNMVNAILEGRKTQTRIVMKPQPEPYPDDLKDKDWVIDKKHKFWWACKITECMVSMDMLKEIDPCTKGFAGGFCSYGKIGDQLWVKETFVHIKEALPGDLDIMYKAECVKYACAVGKWKSPISMPRWASRITLEITDIRVERLQEIKNTELFMEGRSIKDDIYIEYGKYKLAKEWFKNLWNSIHKKQHRWEDNPFVWVISFKKIKSNQKRS